MDRDIAYWLALTRVEGIDCVTSRKLIDAYPHPRDIFEEARSGEPLPGLDKRAARGLARFDDWGWVESELKRVEESGARLIPYGSPEYPPLLVQVPDSPPVLYASGLECPWENPSVAVVGTRRPSTYGRAASERLARELASLGIDVISGLARGCDSAAHKGALASGGPGVTVGVLGTGIDRVYPRENTRLFDEMREKGLILSEYPVGTPPGRTNFPRRNRIISALSLGVLVVEAPVRSGALMTARIALDYGRDAFAVPGQAGAARSSGTNGLIKEGAMLVENAEDVVEALGLTGLLEHGDGPGEGEEEKGAAPAGTSLTDVERRVLRALGDPGAEPVHVDTVSEETGLAPQALSPVLLGLELKGLVTQHPGKSFSRRGG